MKTMFKKAVSVLASAVMLGSTIGMAAAVSYPAPFNAGNSAVVYGASAAESDMVAATSIQSDINAALVSDGSGVTTVTGGDSFDLERSSDLFNLGENMTSFYSTLDEGELSNVLAKGKYLNDNNDDFEYDQEITLQALSLTHFQNDDYSDQPAIGFELLDGTVVLNYTLDFTPDDVTSSTADWNDLEQTDIEILGKSYFISEATNASGSAKLTLLDSANTAIVSEGDTITMNAGGVSYDVSIDFIDSDEVKLNVNGESTNKLTAGDTFEISENVFVAAKEILYTDKQGSIGKAEVSIGSGKIEIENGQEVQINDEDVDGLTAVIASGTTLDKIRLDWALDDDMFITKDSELVMPGFANVKFAMGDFVAAAKETIKIESNSDAVKLTAPIEDGEASFKILYGNGTIYQGTGKDSTNLLLTTNESYVNITDIDRQTFVASWTDGTAVESYILEVSKIDDSDASKNTTTIRSVVDTNNAINVDVGENEDIGRLRFTVDAANKDDDDADITVSAVSSGTVSLHKLYTVEGLQIDLPFEHSALNYTADPAPAYAIETNATATGYTSQTTYVLGFTEENENGDIGAGESFNVTLGWDSSEEEPEVTSSVAFDSGNEHETDDGTDKYEGMVESSLATKTLRDASGDLTTVTITYNGEEAYASVYVAEADATVSSSSGVAIVMDSASVSGKNIVVVGGSAINTVAAELVGDVRGPAFTEATGVGAGEFLIETFAYNGKVAMLVAGYDAADTTKAATYLTNTADDILAEAGKKYTGSSATEATLVTA